jgi:hypothetical protein
MNEEKQLLHRMVIKYRHHFLKAEATKSIHGYQEACSAMQLKDLCREKDLSYLKTLSTVNIT